MRTPDHIKLRYIMLNHFEKGWTAAQSFRDLTNTYGEGTIGVSTELVCSIPIRRQGCRGQRRKRQAFRTWRWCTIRGRRADESYTTRMLGEEFDHLTIVRHLLQLGKVCRWRLCSLEFFLSFNQLFSLWKYKFKLDLKMLDNYAPT